MSDWDPKFGPEPTEEERREAEELARYMDGDLNAKVDPETKKMIALLRLAGMSEKQRQEVFARTQKKKRRPLRFALALAAAAIIAAIVWTRVDLPQTDIPPPDAALLKAQAEAAHGQDRDALEQAMAAYRRLLVAPPKLKAAAEIYARVDAAKDPREAAAALEAFAQTPRPKAWSEREHKAIVQDAYVRLAEIALEAKDGEKALAAIDRGVALGVEQDVFGVNLLLTRAAAFRAVGNEEKEAAAVHEALLLSDALLAATLGEAE